jgi:hypothetical protein
MRERTGEGGRREREEKGGEREGEREKDSKGEYWKRIGEGEREREAVCEREE